MRNFIFSCCLIFVGASAALATPFDASGEAFQADLYPSQRTAVIRLTKQLVEQIKQKSPQVDSIRIQDDAPGLREALHDEFPQASLGTKEGAVTFAVAVDAQDPKHGHVVVNAIGTDLAITASAKFVDKPWADDWAMFANSNSKVRWLSAQSPTPGTSAQEAILSARRAARAELQQLVETELNARVARRGGAHVPISHEWLEKRVVNSLQLPSNDGILVKDTFVQKFSRPYGDVWQAAVLIDASPKVIGQLADSYTRAANARFATKAGGAAGIAGIMLVLGLLYAFLNSVTRGYFMWRLRAVAFLAAIAGVLIVFAANM